MVGFSGNVFKNQELDEQKEISVISDSIKISQNDIKKQLDEVKQLMRDDKYDESLKFIHDIMMNAYVIDDNIMGELVKLEYECYCNLHDEFMENECRQYMIHKAHALDFLKNDVLWIFFPSFPCDQARWNEKGLQKLAEKFCENNQVWYIGGTDACPYDGIYATDLLKREKNVKVFPFQKRRENSTEITILPPKNVDSSNIVVVTTTLNGIEYAKKEGYRCVYIDPSVTELHDKYFESLPFSIYFWIRHRWWTLAFKQRKCYHIADLIITKRRKLIKKRKNILLLSQTKSGNVSLNLSILEEKIKNFLHDSSVENIV